MPNTQPADSETRAQRLKEVGDFTASIAHDFNSILQVIVMGVPLLRARISPMDERVLDRMESAGKRGTEMIGQLLEFVRGGSEVTYKQVSVEYLVREIGALMRTTFPASIEVQTRVGPGTMDVHCDPTQIMQVLDNLVCNAREAMPEGGTLSLRAQNMTQAAGMIGPSVEFSVSDTGVGIADAALPHVWEPFWTSRPHSGGTGLGLPTVRRIVEAHHGAVTVKTGKDGTTFSFYLPAGLPAAVAPKPEPAPNGNGHLIMLVDDDAGVRELMTLSLESLGYRVLSAGNGLEALAAFKAGEKVDLIISDLSMPICDGEMLVKALRAQGFTTPAIFLSGYSSPTPSGVDAVAILRKPVTREVLLTKIKEALK